VAHLYLTPETDSVYLDLTAGDGSPVKMAEPADGVYLHMDADGVLVAVEVMDLSRRGGGEGDEPDMGHLHVNPDTDSLYLDVSAGTRSPVNGAAVAEGVVLHVDEAGVLVAVEVMDLSRRGGLHVDDLDAAPGSPRPALFEAIERAARGHGKAKGRD
jgi:uncharacterized protein YuzE